MVSSPISVPDFSNTRYAEASPLQIPRDRLGPVSKWIAHSFQGKPSAGFGGTAGLKCSHWLALSC